MKPASILITDDESNIRLMLRIALESSGYRVQEAANGQEALEAIRLEVPQVMILDLSMPVLDGMGVLTQLKPLPDGDKPRVIVLTAYGSIAAAVKATRLGAVDFLEKPVTPDELRRSVADVLAEPQPMPQQDLQRFAGGYTAVLDRVRKALRLANYADAQSMLMAAADLGGRDAAYFNLLGVLYEAQHQWRLAKKFYGKAIAANRKYAPAQQNMRRLYELNTFGRSAETVALGDEVDALFARLPETARR